MAFKLTQSKEPRWYSVAVPEGAGAVRVQVVTPGLTELCEVQSRCRLTTPAPDFRAYFREVAKRWFVAFEGIVGDDDSPIANTLENRIVLLDKRSINNAVVAALDDSSEWRAEGNAEAG